MKTLIVGMGEVGKALAQVLEPHYDVFKKDLGAAEIPDGIEMLHVCIRYSSEFLTIVRDYVEQYRPLLVNVCTTCPPGTTEQLGEFAVHSTTRGLHPNLATGLKTITKHIGGPMALDVAAYFEAADVPCITHPLAKITELAHLLNNAAYGVNLMLADEMAAICRQFGVDYYEAVLRYTQTNNDGFRALGHDSKCRMILTPPGGSIGGHCVMQSGKMLVDAGVNTRLISRLASYNNVPAPAVGTVDPDYARNGANA